MSLSVDFIPWFAHFACTRQLNRYSFIVISSQQLQRSSQLTCAICRINIEFLPFKSIEIHYNAFANFGLYQEKHYFDY